MPTWFATFDGVFFLGVATTFFGVVTLIIKKCSESRCEDCSVCYGMIKIHRNVMLENEEKELELENSVNNVNNQI